MMDRPGFISILQNEAGVTFFFPPMLDVLQHEFSKGNLTVFEFNILM